MICNHEEIMITYNFLKNLLIISIFIKNNNKKLFTHLIILWMSLSSFYFFLKQILKWFFKKTVPLFLNEDRLGWPRRSGTPSELRRFGVDGTSFVAWFQSDESDWNHILKFRFNSTVRRFLIYFFMRYNVSLIFIIYFASLNILNDKNYFKIVIYLCNLLLKLIFIYNSILNIK